jgi:hypothetical protein
VRKERCLIVAHLHYGKPSHTGPLHSRHTVSVNRNVTAE